MLRMKKTLHDQKLGAWVAVSRWHVVVPLVFEETVNSKRYCSMLHDFIDLLEEDEITYSWFQQDGATTHTANNSMKLLKEIFGERVISSNLWPPRSSDLTPPDFYMWEAAKSPVYCDRPRTLNELKAAITAYIRKSHKQICRKCLRIKLNGFRPVSTLVNITSNIFYKCTATFRTQIRRKCLLIKLNEFRPV
jgi:hypothetical protein